MIRGILLVFISFSLTVMAEENQTLHFTFKRSGTTSDMPISEYSNAISDYIISGLGNQYVEAINTHINCSAGRTTTGIRIGGDNASGCLKFTLKPEYRIIPSIVTIDALQYYKTDSTPYEASISINGSEPQYIQGSSNTECHTYTYTVDTSSPIEYVEIATSNRVYIRSLTIYPIDYDDIDEIQWDCESSTLRYYNINGVEVDPNTAGKGVYIVTDGKKAIKALIDPSTH